MYMYTPLQSSDAQPTGGLREYHQAQRTQQAFLAPRNPFLDIRAIIFGFRTPIYPPTKAQHLSATTPCRGGHPRARASPAFPSFSRLLCGVYRHVGPVQNKSTRPGLIGRRWDSSAWAAASGWTPLALAPAMVPRAPCLAPGGAAGLTRTRSPAPVLRAAAGSTSPVLVRTGCPSPPVLLSRTGSPFPGALCPRAAGLASTIVAGSPLPVGRHTDASPSWFWFSTTTG